jgi:hypothetical protein
VVRVYDMSTNYSPIMRWKADEAEISCVRFSRDETAIYTLGTEDKVRGRARTRVLRGGGALLVWSRCPSR